ncbi:MAG: hypothetical protein ACFFAO_11480 [Candidatus Hermodarchaeota archaeon]
MVIRESGLLFRGFTVLYASYHKTSDEKIDKDLRSALLTALLNFAESAFTTDAIEYFEMKKFAISFIEDKIKAEDSPVKEPLIAYVILDKEKKIDKYISKTVIPLLKRVISLFKESYDGKNLSEISQFESFKGNLDLIFGDVKDSLDQKLKDTLF